MKKLTRILLALAACVLAVTLAAGSVCAAEIAGSRTYDGRFTDVSESAWYYKNVAEAYELGLINGRSDTAFADMRALLRRYMRVILHLALR